jgi:hypothetical protein
MLFQMLVGTLFNQYCISDKEHNENTSPVCYFGQLDMSRQCPEWFFGRLAEVQYGSSDNWGLVHLMLIVTGHSMS